MRAAVVVRPGTADAFEVRLLPDPEPGPDDVLVAVRAAAVSRPDLGWRLGRYRPPATVHPDVPGMEIAGVVERVGERVGEWRPGDRVLALLEGGGYGSKVAVHRRLLMPVPSNLDLEQAAAIPDSFITAFDALVLQCRPRLGQTVLVHAAGSGVGIAAVQLAAVAGCRVFGTARSDEKLERLRAFGLEVGVNATTTDFAEVIAEATAGRGVDVVLDLVGAAYWDDNLRAVASTGQMVVIGTLGGAQTTIDLGRLQGKRMRVAGTALHRRPFEEMARLIQAFGTEVLPLFASGRLAPVIDSVYSLEDVAAAHRAMETNATFGKLIIRHEA